MTVTQEPAFRPRLGLIDMARGIALVAMATYHFSWDLEFFGYLDPGTASSGILKIYARAIASSFLVLVGISLVLAHDNGIRWASFARRWGLVAAAAAVITAATYAFTPQSFVFFGILHQIAVASLLGLAFLRLPALALVALGAGVFFAAPQLRGVVPDGMAFWWTGLAPTIPLSNDFVPVFPWFSAVLAGMAIGKVIAAAPQRVPEPAKNRAVSGLQWLGRRSLAVYLIHQPVLIGLVAAFAWIAPPGPNPEAFGNACRQSCRQSSDGGGDCAVYCACAEVELTIAGKMQSVMTVPEFATSDLETGAIMALCAREAGFGAIEQEEGVQP